jgi:alkylhydroperoxidase/carboxymuconolactone decarboxylase family protein YurZ
MALPEAQQKAFDEFYDSVRNNTVLDVKTTMMIHLASAMAVACHPCVQYDVSQAETVGISEEERGAIQAIVMAVSGGRVMMQFGVARGCGGPRECEA